jgi:hypothetical protein
VGRVVVVVDVGGDHLPGLVEGFELVAPDTAFLEVAEPLPGNGKDQVLYQVDASVDRAGEVPDARWDLAVLADLPAADERPHPSGRAEHDGDVVTRASVHVDEVRASEAPDTLPASCEVAGGQRPPVVGALERGGQRRTSARRMRAG